MSAPRRWGLAAWLLVLGGCSRTTTLHLPLPPHDGAASLVVASEPSGRVALHALSLGASPVLTLDGPDLGLGDSVALTALTFAAPLAELQIPEGAVQRADPADEAPRALPPSLAIYSAKIDLTDADAPAAWQRAGALDPALDAFRLPAATTPCLDLDATLHDVDSPEPAQFLVVIDDEYALTATADGRFFMLGADGSAEPVTPAGLVPFRSAHRDGDALWLGGLAGTVAKVEVTRGAEGWSIASTSALQFPVLGNVVWLEGHSTHEATELLALDYTGRLARFDGVEWTLLYTFEPTPPNTLGPISALTEVARGEYLAIEQLTPGLAVRVKDGVASEEHVPTRDALHTLAQVPGLGTVLGTSEGRFLVHDGTAWSELPGSPVTVWILGTQPYRDGFVYGTAWDNFGQYVLGHGFCSTTMPGAFEIRFTAALGDALIAIGGNPNTPYTPFAVLSRR